MPNASLEGLTLHVENVERSLEFYSKIPGATVEAHYPGNFAMLRIGKARLGLLGHAQNQRFHIEVETEDLDAMYQTLRSEGIEPDGPPKQEEWGEIDFLVKDPDGNIVEFGLPHA
jgi:catechol 2,3-dioxygenase-like lactoylglutathione lyase family enzyme